MEQETDFTSADVLVVGGGAAGLAVSIFSARRLADSSVVLLDGGRELGEKILMSGGGRCNVTNRHVTPDDYSGASRNAIGRVLSVFTADQTVAFFGEIGVELREEEDGKLFSAAGRARAVRDALVKEAERSGVRIRTDRRVTRLDRCRGGLHVVTESGAVIARTVVLATGGMSYPQTGSDGGGYGLAEGLGHSLGATTPALVPLVLDGDFHVPLSGISHDVELTVRVAGSKPVRFVGSLLWTHFGVSGPVVLDASRYWHRAVLEDREVAISASFLPGEEFTTVERRLIDLASDRPKLTLRKVVSSWIPMRVAEAIISHTGLNGQTEVGGLSRDVRRQLVHALLEWPLPVVDSRGYDHAEVTAGGIPLSEVDPKRMASRRCPGLYLVGEILDVDGRIGGFNFQWAWSSAWVAATAIAQEIEAQ